MTPAHDPRLGLLEGVEGSLITVYGPPGVGTSSLARQAFPDHTVVPAREATLPSLRARRGPVLWDDVDPRLAAEAWSPELGPVVLATTGRTRRPEERAVRIDPLPDDAVAELLAERGPAVRGLAAACLGLPGLVHRAHELHTLLQRIPTPADWLRLGPVPGRRSPRQDLEEQVERAPDAAPLLDLLGAFGGPFLLTDVEALSDADPLPALGAAVDASLAIPLAVGFQVPPLLRAHLAQRPGSEARRVQALEALGAVCPAVVTRLEDDGSTPPVGHRFHDLLTASEARVPGWSAALWLATLQRPTDVPRRHLTRARHDAPNDPLVARSLARHLRATGALQEAEDVLGTVDDPGAHRELGALLHRSRRLDQAAGVYAHDVGRSRRADALREANLAAIAHDRGELATAAEGYGRALRALSMLDDDRSTGLIASNLGALHAEAGETDAARSCFARALRALETAHEPRLWSIATGNLAWLEARTGAADRGLRLLHRALEEGAPDERTAATLWMRVGAIHGSRGDTEAAAIAFDTVDSLLLGSEDRFAVALAELFRAFLHLAEGRRLDVLGAIERADAEPLSTSDDARTAVAWLHALLRRRPGQSLVIGPAGSTVRTPDGTTHTLTNGAAKRILEGLADRWSPGAAGLDLDELFELGWPGERAVTSARRNRVHVALSTLRKAGLKPFIVRDATGHLLDPAVPVLRQDA